MNAIEANNNNKNKSYLKGKAKFYQLEIKKSLTILLHSKRNRNCLKRGPTP